MRVRSLGREDPLAEGVAPTPVFLECVCGHAIATVNLWRVGTIYWSYLFFPAQFL